VKKEQLVDSIRPANRLAMTIPHGPDPGLPPDAVATSTTAIPVFPTAPTEYELSNVGGNGIPNVHAELHPQHYYNYAVTTSHGEVMAEPYCSQIPLVPATSVSVSEQSPYHHVYGSSTTGSSVAIATGPPQPPSVMVVSRPPQVYPGRPPSRYRNSHGALTCCGITLIVVIICFTCCLIPVVAIIIAWATATTVGDSWDDDYWNNVALQDDMI
jgi:hypothetical protein